MKKSMLFALVLAALVVLSGFQAYQLYGLKDTVADMSLSGGLASASATPLAGGQKPAGSLPSSVQNLPQMVGGC